MRYTARYTQAFAPGGAPKRSGWFGDGRTHPQPNYLVLCAATLTVALGLRASTARRTKPFRVSSLSKMQMISTRSPIEIQAE
ncbi:hypothetical protein REMIM1_PE00384 (plasmid) [Rhizobium etli bv. mimosae str. Mim1]|nr:hypothetical protein REMIM1_PE00384 [Rhizobium etli bv. mimosae str. Mim1]